MSLIEEQNIDLDEYESIFYSPDADHYERIDNHYYYYFPIGTPLLTVPVLYVATWVTPVVAQTDLADAVANQPPIPVDPGTLSGHVERVIASFFVALAAALIYCIVRRMLSVPRALAVVFIFAFCTSVWSTASRSLWSHGPSLMLLSLALFIYLRSDNNPSSVQFAALPLGFAYIVRPTNSISIAVFSLLVLLTHRRYVVHYAAWLLLVMAAFIIYSYSIYDSLLPTYYLPQRIGDHAGFETALAGNLISPARGLFVFSPVLLLAIPGVGLSFQTGRKRLLTVSIVAIILLHWLAISSFPHWYGGWSIGPRLFTDMMPFFVFLLIPVVGRLKLSGFSLRTLAAIAVVCLALVSFSIHFRCATDEACVSWNYEPNNIDLYQERLWQWDDLQFLR